jgi:hypothetical protein
MPEHRSHCSNDMRHRKERGVPGDAGLAFPWRAEDSLLHQVALLSRHFHSKAILCATPFDTGTGPNPLYPGEGRSALYSNVSCLAAVLPRERPSSATFRSCD